VVFVISPEVTMDSTKLFVLVARNFPVGSRSSAAGLQAFIAMRRRKSVTVVGHRL
jgi:hypothetical protein